MERSSMPTARTIANPRLGRRSLPLLAAPGLWTYATGTATTAHVDQCESRRGAGSSGTVRECFGSWSADGVRRSGKIDGARSIDKGKDVQVRVNGSRIVAKNAPISTRPSYLICHTAAALKPYEAPKRIRSGLVFLSTSNVTQPICVSPLESRIPLPPNSLQSEAVLDALSYA